MLLATTLCESPQRWCHNLPHNCVHSFNYFCDLIESIFHLFDPEALDQKMLKQWKALHEKPMCFWQHFHLLQFEAPKNKMKFQYLMDKFEYFLSKSLCPKMKMKFKPHLAYFGDGVAKSQAETIIVASDYLPSPH